MSSGKIEGNYLKNVQNSLILDESAIFNDYYIQKSINSESKSFIKGSKKDFDLKLKQTTERIIDNHFKAIKEICFILKNSTNLTQKQKFDYCNRQRLFMKLYLHRISEKLEI